MKIVRLIPLLLLLAESCVEPFVIPPVEYERSLVVDGIITDQPQSNFVKLNYSSRVNTNLGDKEGVANAVVTLHDNEGNTEAFKEVFVGTGLYLPTNTAMRGTVGKSYYITIKVNGKDYVSKPSQLFASGTISDVYGKFEENVANFADPTAPQDAIRIYLNSKADPSSQTSYFRWRWLGAYYVKTYPDLRTKIIPPKILIPDPVPCSGKVYNNGNLEVVFPCACCECYITDIPSTVNLSNNQYVAATEFNDMLIATLPYNSTRFYFNYKIRVEQLSLDEVSYEYWNLVKKQQESRSDLFQPNTIRIVGNVTCITDPKERVLGLFSACGLSQVVYEIPKTLRWSKILEHDTLKTDCRSAHTGSTTTKPTFW
jgi:hypothetical protein